MLHSDYTHILCTFAQLLSFISPLISLHQHSTIKISHKREDGVMPTIKDIAQAAGVSHGTVSNVINGRGNVSVEKMRLVWSAAEKLGYKVNSKAQSLRQGGPDRMIALILPGITDERYAAMYEVFQREFAQQGYAVRLYSTCSMETTETAMLADALASQVSAVIVSSCLPDAVPYYHQEAAGLPVVFLQHSGPALSDIMYAAFDPARAGREIADYLQSRRARRIGVFTQPTSAPDTALFLRGFHSVYPENTPSVTILDCPDHQLELRAFAFFESDAEYDYIVCTDRRREAALRAACAYASRHALPPLITVASRAAVTDPAVPVYELDNKQLAHRIVKALLARLQKGAPLETALYLRNDGFRLPAAPPILSEQRLRMLTIASPSTKALNYLLPYLEKSTGIRLELTVLPSLRDVYDVIQTPAREQYDLIRMDVAWMDELAEKLFVPLESIPFNWDGLLSQAIPELGDNYTVSKGVRYCIPYDPSTQLMFYRRDLFTDPTYKRMYLETYRRELEVPRSFADYNQVAGFFTRSLNPASPVQFGCTVAVGTVAVGPSEFMPRLFEEGGNLLDHSGRITIDTPEALRALRNYREAYACSDKRVYGFWENVLEGFADQSAASTVVFINYASHILNSNMSSIAGKLGFAPVPGGRPLLGGGVLGITRSCGHPDTACAFLSWLYSDLVAPVFTMLGGLSPCRSAYKNRDINEKYPWLSTARRSFAVAQRRGSSGYYSNFSELQLEAILASHLRKAILGVTTPEEALRQAQAECDRYFRAK